MRTRGATEEPVQDYLDAARDQDPRHENARPSRQLGGNTRETGRATPINYKESK